MIDSTPPWPRPSTVTHRIWSSWRVSCILGEAFVRRYEGGSSISIPRCSPAFLDSIPIAGLSRGPIHGCTVHFVTPALDHGPVVIQAAVPVLDGDDEASLAARVLVQEHRIFRGGTLVCRGPPYLSFPAGFPLPAASRRRQPDGAGACPDGHAHSACGGSAGFSVDPRGSALFCRGRSFSAPEPPPLTAELILPPQLPPGASGQAGGAAAETLESRFRRPAAAPSGRGPDACNAGEFRTAAGSSTARTRSRTRGLSRKDRAFSTPHFRPSVLAASGRVRYAVIG